jgi:hypothetical protein
VADPTDELIDRLADLLDKGPAGLPARDPSDAAAGELDAELLDLAALADQLCLLRDVDLPDVRSVGTREDLPRSADREEAHRRDSAGGPPFPARRRSPNRWLGRLVFAAVGLVISGFYNFASAPY